MPADAPPFRCPYCDRLSHHPTDAANRYCPCCGNPPLLPKLCPHTAELLRRLGLRVAR